MHLYSLDIRPAPNQLPDNLLPGTGRPIRRGGVQVDNVIPIAHLRSVNKHETRQHTEVGAEIRQPLHDLSVIVQAPLGEGPGGVGIGHIPHRFIHLVGKTDQGNAVFPDQVEITIGGIRLTIFATAKDELYLGVELSGGDGITGGLEKPPGTGAPARGKPADFITIIHGYFFVRNCDFTLAQVLKRRTYMLDRRP